MKLGLDPMDIARCRMARAQLDQLKLSLRGLRGDELRDALADMREAARALERFPRHVIQAMDARLYAGRYADDHQDLNEQGAERLRKWASE